VTSKTGLRALARRAHSAAELRQKLQRRALDPAGVEPLLEDLAARGWLDDRRFALGYARYRAGTGRYGRARVARELHRRGVAQELMEEALAEVFPEEEQQRPLVRQRIARRLQGKKRPYSQRLLRSVYAGLLRAGFPSAIIRDELFAQARQALADDLEAAEPDSGSPDSGKEESV